MLPTSSIACRTSGGVRPAIASSSSNTLGSVASARAISSRLRPGVPRLLAGACTRWARPTRSITASARSRASAACGARRKAPTMTLSRPVMSSNVSGTWKLRAMPSAARPSGVARVMSCCSKCTVPAVGGRSPVRQLKKEDLPAPFGPIRPSTSPPSTPTLASSTALKLPNALVTCRASSSTARLPAEEVENPAREEAREQHDDGAINDEGEAAALAAQQIVRHFLERHQDRRPDQWPEQVAGPAERRHDQHFHRDQDAQPGLRVHEAEQRRIQPSRHRGQRGAEQ